MFIPPSTKCVFINPDWCTTSSIKGAERSATADGNDSAAGGDCASAAACPGKPYRRGAQPFCCTRRANCGARARDTALFRRRIGRQRRASVRRWLAARAARLSEAAGRGLSRALQTPTTSPAPEAVAPALDGHSQSFGRVLTIVGGDCALLEHAGTIQLLSLPVAERWLRQAQLTPGQSPVCAQPLLIPLRLKVSADEKPRCKSPIFVGRIGY